MSAAFQTWSLRDSPVPSANEMFRSLGSLTEWLLSPREGTDYTTPFNYAYQTDENIYAWLERPENAFRLKQVGRGMSAGRAAEGSTSVTETRGMSVPLASGRHRAHLC